jgi:WhiB family redox-sensing transcriptional regulator
MLTIVGLSWMGRAACKSDPDRQFPGWNTEAIVAAKAVCAICPVRVECLQVALDQDEQEGVWGGLTPTERNRLKEGVHSSVPCPGCGRLRALTAEGLVRVHKSASGFVCSGSGSRP